VRTRSRLRQLLGFARPLLRRTRTQVRRARLVGYVLAQRAQGRGICVLVSGITAKGLAAAAHAARTARRVRIPVEVLVLDFVHGPTLEETLATFPADVPVRRFWRAAAPGGGGATPRHSTATLTQAPVPDPEAGGWRSGYYRAGKPVLAMTGQAGATTVDHYGPDATPVRRDEIDGRGKLVRVIDLHPATGREVTHRYLDVEGACWLSVEVNAGKGTPGRTQQHRPRVREFPSFRAAQADWVAGYLRAAVRPQRILAAGKIGRAIAQAIDEPYASVGVDGSLQQHSQGAAATK
jgi:hypothetical protein